MTSPPSYTVTSPPPTAPKSGNFPEMTQHEVKPTADFTSQIDPQADHTVLLKLKEGKEYKLVRVVFESKRLA